MNILGISAFYHDSAAALVRDGEIVAAAQEERFTRKKHDAGFPSHAIAYCLQAASLKPDEIDYVCFYEKPLRKFERLLEPILRTAPSGFRSFRMAIPLWLKERLWMAGTIQKALTVQPRSPLIFTDHHESHAASAFFPSPFDEAAIVTLDGVGEWSTTTLGYGSENRITLAQHLQFPHSLGLLYSAFTYYCGFRVNSGEYKLMGLAPYGPAEIPRRHHEAPHRHQTGRQLLARHELLQLLPGAHDDERALRPVVRGSAPSDRIEPGTAAHGSRRQHSVGHRGHPPEQWDDTFTSKTGSRNLVLAGGVALNCVANGRLLREGSFKSIWIQPAAGDAGGALGAALFVWYQLLNNPRRPNPHDAQKGSLLGPHWSSSDIEQFVLEQGATYAKLGDEAELLGEVTRHLAAGKIIGWFSGPMEFGPRALGARSILGDARSTAMQSVMNLRIKFRESFRPFAPSVLREEAADWFDCDVDSPYMLLVADIAGRRKRDMTSEERQLFGIDQLNVPRSRYRQ